MSMANESQTMGNISNYAEILLHCIMGEAAHTHNVFQMLYHDGELVLCICYVELDLRTSFYKTANVNVFRTHG